MQAVQSRPRVTEKVERHLRHRNLQVLRLPFMNGPTASTEPLTIRDRGSHQGSIPYSTSSLTAFI